MFVNNALAPIQVRWSPNLVSHTLGHRGRGDKISEIQGQRSRSVGEVCALLNALLVIVVIVTIVVVVVMKLCCCNDIEPLQSGFCHSRTSASLRTRHTQWQRQWRSVGSGQSVHATDRYRWESSDEST